MTDEELASGQTLQTPPPSGTDDASDGGTLDSRRINRIADIKVECRRTRSITRPIISFRDFELPFTLFHSAVTADGRMTAHPGHSRCITSNQASNASFLPKNRHKAIPAGIGTILHKFPLLPSRLPRGGKHPIRVITDTLIPVQIHLKYSCADATDDLIGKLQLLPVPLITLTGQFCSSFRLLVAASPRKG
ncbi:dihydrofolate reductase family protein [Bhargavaea cecembensis]|uniref:dihydrofolate reductase family protein n=1 Tax=Bhargavaea cecembensis TaxID=394098 RepID=UPI0012E93ED7|nr:dihydrofolate reductase family protein [Bhargavaea cecembensis]